MTQLKLLACLLLVSAATFDGLAGHSIAQQPGNAAWSANGSGLLYGGTAPAYMGRANQAAYLQSPGQAPIVGGPPVSQPPSAACATGAATAGSCDCDPCCGPGWRVYGDLLYLRPGNAEVPYAVPINGPIVPPPVSPVEVGPVALLDPNYEPGFRVGFERVIDCRTGFGGSYTQLDTQTSDAVVAPLGQALRSLTIHPSTLNAAGDFVAASGQYDLGFKLADIDYRWTLACGDDWDARCVVGARYGHLYQNLLTTYTFNGVQSVATAINFDGGGPKIGIQVERHGRAGFVVYGTGMASFLAGEFNASYLQTDAFGGTVVTTSWHGSRVVPILDFELGAGWESPGGMVRVTGGYMVSGWFNTVITRDFIESVQRTNFNGLNDGISFDGLVARLQVNF